MSEDFVFNMKATKVRKSNGELLESLREFSQLKQGASFTTIDYDNWIDKIASSGVICRRFESWKKALAMIGVNGSRERQYTDEQLMSHLELVWRTVGYPPGKKIISKYGDGISEKQYKNRWGSLKKACELLSQYKSGTISWEAISPDKTSCELDSPTFQARKPLKQSLRFEVMKKDNNKCVKCGNSPPDCVLHVDHIIPLSKGGTDDINNLQTLCSDCNLGKSNRHMV